MKLKSNIVYKHISLVLLGAGLICLLTACTSNNENGYSETSKEPQQVSADVSSKQSQTSVNVNSEQSQISANVNSEQSQTSVNVNSEQSEIPVNVNKEQPQTSTNVNNKQPQTSVNINNEPLPVSSDVSNKQPNTSSKENVLPLSLEESYKAILLEHGEFISTDLQNKQLNLDSIKEVVTDDDSIQVAVTKFTTADLNGDGKAEIILWLQINGISDYGFEILQYQEGSVYGYTLPYRTFMELKTDGTFTFSGGADSGIGKLRFSENGYTVDKLHYTESKYDSNNELKIQYFINGETCLEEEFNNTISQQEQKSNVKWYDLSVDNINTALKNIS